MKFRQEKYNHEAAVFKQSAFIWLGLVLVTCCALPLLLVLLSGGGLGAWGVILTHNLVVALQLGSLKDREALSQEHF